jgi:hypothetical protein
MVAIALPVASRSIAPAGTDRAGSLSCSSADANLIVIAATTLRFSGRAHAVTEGKPINLRLLGTGAVASKPASIN